MEPRFGHDFSRVRVHTDERAAKSASAVNSLAYTVGQDVVFNERQYMPGTTTGLRLLAHELTHVVQQGNAASNKKIAGMNQPGDSYEQEAEKIAHDVVGKGQQKTRVHEPQAGLHSGGEVEGGVYTEDEIVGGETPRAGILQRQGGTGTAPAPTAPAPTPAAAATLTYSTKKVRTANGCGGYTYAVTWGLSGGSTSTNGFIVQKLTFDLKRALCAGGRNDFTKTYWEAWQVRGGKIFVGTSTSPHVADTFQVNSTPDQKGVNLEEGYARYIDGYTEPLSWGTVPEAGSLPATNTKPTGWSDSGATHRSIKCTFNCCGKTEGGTIEGDG